MVVGEVRFLPQFLIKTTHIMNRELDYYLVLYNDNLGNQITKPFFDDENGSLRQVAVVFVYQK